jgi:hypothetical protein
MTNYLQVVFFNIVHQPIGHQAQGQNTAQQSRQPAGEPIFVAVPPKPQRLLHSEAYIKYNICLIPLGSYH